MCFLTQRIFECAYNVIYWRRLEWVSACATAEKRRGTRTFDCIFCVLCGYSSAHSALKKSGYTRSTNTLTILQRSDLLIREGERDRRSLHTVSRWCETSEGFKFTDKVGLIEITTVVCNVSEGCILLRNPLQAVLETVDLLIQFRRKACVLQKEFLQVP